MSVTCKQLRQAAGITERQRGYWQWLGLLVPSVRHPATTRGRPSAGTGALYSERDVIAARLIRVLSDAGLHVRIAARAASNVANHVPYPDGALLIVDPTNDLVTVAVTDGELIDAVNRSSGQFFAVSLRNVRIGAYT